MTVRVCTWMPPPHDAVHGDQSVQFDTTQSVLVHAKVLQLVLLTRTGHAPPAEAGVTTMRVCTAVPPPQGSLQLDHGDQSLTTQGHGCVLHNCDCAKTGQGAPPLAAPTNTVRVWT